MNDVSGTSWTPRFLKIAKPESGPLLSGPFLWRLQSALVVGESASAESDMYGYVGANGLFEMTNVPTDQRFRPADSQARRLAHRVSVKKWKTRSNDMPGSSSCTPPCC